MATKSILKNINIKSRNQARNLANALEYAEHHPGKPAEMHHHVTELKGQNIKLLFSDL
jgi:hypothetical protein